MNRNCILSFVIVAGGIAVLLASTAQSQFGAPKAFVNLQPTTPGASQSGHVNIGGTIRTGSASVSGNVFASQFIGGGSGLTGVNADQLDSLDSTAFLQSVPNPLTLSGPSPTHIIGAINSSDSPFAAAIFGESLSNVAMNAGGVFYSHSQNGVALYCRNFNTIGDSSGISSESDSVLGSGIFGFASSSTGSTYGVSGEAVSDAGIGVSGNAFHSTGANYGVRGHSGSPNGYGVFSSGRFAATSTKAFRIDHPLEPENKYLMHYCSEGPEPLNVYTGNVTTDANGYSTVNLPGYFEEINKSPRYTLTVVDDGERKDFILVKVVRKIRDNQFTVRTSVGHVEVSWRVDAIRNDRWVQEYGAPVEVEKPENERGKYQHPELYGMPPSRGIFYRAKQERFMLFPRK